MALNNSINSGQTLDSTSTVQHAKLGLGVAASNNELSINGKASIGYSDTAAPTGGLIVSGLVGVGTSSPSSDSGINIVPSGSSILRGLSVNGNFTGTSQIGVSSNGTFSNAASFAQCILSQPTFAAAGATSIANASCFYASPFYTGNAGTITESYGFIYDGGSALVGTVTTAYGGYFSDPAAGSTKVALYSKNLAIGSYTGTTPPVNGLIVSGNVGVGTSTTTLAELTLASTSTASSGAARGFLIGTGTLTASANNDSLRAQEISSITFAKGAFTNLGVVLCQLTCSSHSATGAGTIANAYGLLISDSFALTATNKWSLYNASTDQSYFAGNVGIGTTTAPITSSSAGRVYLSVKGSSSIGAFELSSAAADADGVGLGQIFFSDSNQTDPEKRSVLIQGVTQGATANNRGGSFRLQTKLNGSVSLVEAFRINNVQFTGLGNIEPVNRLDVNGACAIGSYAGVNTAPTEGLIVSGSVGIGSTSFTSSEKVRIDGGSTEATCLNVRGTLAASFGLIADDQTCISARATFSPSASITNAMDIFCNPSFTPGGGVVITNAANLYLHTGAQSGAGSVTNGYAIYARNPAFGTNKYGAYIEGNVGIGNATPASGINLHVGSNATASAVAVRINTDGAANDNPVLSQVANGVSEWVLATDRATAKILFSLNPASYTSANLVSGAKMAVDSNGVAIGSYAGVNSPPSGGLIVSGNAAFGATSAGTADYLFSSATETILRIEATGANDDSVLSIQNGTIDWRWALDGATQILYLNGGTDFLSIDNTGNLDVLEGDLSIADIGNGINVAEGANARMGTATLNGGATATVVVNTTAVTANSRIFITGQTLGTIVLGAGYSVSARTAGTSFTITSSTTLDTSIVAWIIFEPI